MRGGQDRRQERNEAGIHAEGLQCREEHERGSVPKPAPRLLRAPHGYHQIAIRQSGEQAIAAAHQGRRQSGEAHIGIAVAGVYGVRKQTQEDAAQGLTGIPHPFRI